MASPLRVILISDFNLANFAGYLENDEASPRVDAASGEFGMVFQVLNQPDLPIWSPKPDYAVVWTIPERIIPSFQCVLEFQSISLDTLAAEVNQFCQAVAGAASRVSALFLPTWVLDPRRRTGGLTDYAGESGASLLIAKMNLWLAENLRGIPNVFLFNAGLWIARCGPNSFAPKLWYQAKIPFGNQVFLEAVREVKAAIRSLRGEARKLILLDLDDTLWGGTVGESGWESLRLGGHDPVGEAYLDFQRALKALARRGVLLGIVSKNDEAVALEALQKHPEMLLRRADFAALSINWNDKAQNVIGVIAGLNLGLQSVVFIDDNPAERHRVREALPEVFVPDWPEDPMLFRQALDGLDVFNTPHFSQEDAHRTELYASERKRGEIRQLAASMDEWLRSLEITVAVQELGAQNRLRATQLFNKTNQMNLSTRRMGEMELAAWSSLPGNHLWVFRVSDRHGDSGLTGISSLSLNGKRAQVVDFILSCRVMGRRVEETMVHWLVVQARKLGAAEVMAEYLPTEKNRPCREFWERSGFSRNGENTFIWDASRPYPLPEFISLPPI